MHVVGTGRRPRWWRGSCRRAWRVVESLSARRRPRSSADHEAVGPRVERGTPAAGASARSCAKPIWVYWQSGRDEPPASMAPARPASSSSQASLIAYSDDSARGVEREAPAAEGAAPSRATPPGARRRSGSAGVGGRGASVRVCRRARRGTDRSTSVGAAGRCCRAPRRRAIDPRPRFRQRPRRGSGRRARVEQRVEFADQFRTDAQAREVRLERVEVVAAGGVDGVGVGDRAGRCSGRAAAPTGRGYLAARSAAVSTWFQKRARSSGPPGKPAGEGDDGDAVGH